MSYASIARTAGTPVGSLESLVDGGANICVTGDIALLNDLISIPPLPISVALHGESTMDDCCTAHGRLPIQLDDGLVFWQQCYYSKNVIETIISPQLIVNSSNVFCSWQQTGYRDDDGTPGSIRFDSHDGCISMQMTLWMKDGLYYCPTDIYTVHNAPAIWCSLAAHQLAMLSDNIGSPVPPPHINAVLDSSQSQRLNKWSLRCGFYD
jgi:hypothetical protein